MKQVLFIFFIFSIHLFYFSYTMKIHIVQQQVDTAPDKIKFLRQNRKMSSDESKFSKVCLGIFNTFSQMGSKAFDIYKGCESKYELLGEDDPEIIKDRPLCYDYLNQFYCNYKIINLEEDKKADNTLNDSCGDESLIESVLSIIKGCFNEYTNGVTKPAYICPGLNEITLKIQNADDFCMKAEKKEVIVSSNEEEENYTVYSTIKESDKTNCKYITQMYNACIDSDNLLYPFSDYKRCFNKNNAMFFCNKLGTYTDQEKKIVREEYIYIFIILLVSALTLFSPHLATNH